MRAVKTTALGLILTLACTTFAPAQSLRESTGPAEFPPSSFKGSQYVDSSGCVFVRAGVGDATTWVPRVSRDRRVICGAKPTFASAQPQTVPVIKDPPTQTATVPKATTAPVAPAASTAATASTTTTITKPTSKPESKSAKTTTSQECPEASTLSKQYIGDGSRYVVRCGPQKEHPGSYGVGPKVKTTSPVSPQSKVIRPAKPQLPKNYKPAFDDDRLNPYRNRRTAMGDAQMRMVWTDTVPRRLVQAPVAQDIYLTDAQIQYRKNNNITRSKAVKTPKPLAKAKHRYVSIGAYKDPKQAELAARKLQSKGLQVRYGTYKKNGQSLRMVMAGPYQTQDQLNNAMSKARQAGFTKATFRK
ncbi:MAG: SPOR domain-containing protein [Pseudoruegeria sp.]